MNIKEKLVTVRELVDGYNDNDEEGVVGFSGRLDIRPPYQREFVYNRSQMEAVINTIRSGFPLNVMYWSKRNDGSYEIIDGQQRTLSICKYIDGEFSHKGLAFGNLQDDQVEQIMNYKLSIYECEGTNSEKLSWFETINIAGEKLTNQELRNAVYHGPWLTDAKRYFSVKKGPAIAKGSPYLTGSPIRQEFLETAIKWISKNNIVEYMSANQNKPTAVELWSHFSTVIDWVESIFINYRAEMKGIDWGTLYDKHSKSTFNPKDVEKEIVRLMSDTDVTNKKGIYPYVLSKEEKHLNIRSFDDRMRRQAFERQNGICIKCSGNFNIEDMQADHVIPWSKGGQTIESNCQMLCRECNARKSNN